MKLNTRLMLIFLCLWGSGLATHQAMAQNVTSDPLISLAVDDQPLGDVLEIITQDTGYQFKLDRKWRDYPVSATIGNLPLEQGLKRILRSLNHTIIWESEKIITIMVFGKVDSRSPSSAISFASPPQAEPDETEPPTETEHLSEDETEPGDAAGEVQSTGETASDADLNADSSEEVSGEPAVPPQSSAEDPPGEVQVEN
jgi:hypothetical protein